MRFLGFENVTLIKNNFQTQPLSFVSIVLPLPIGFYVILYNRVHN